MAETKSQAPAPTVTTSRNSTPREVLAQRVKNAQDMGLMTPKLQHQFDRMAANLLKGKK